MNFKHCGMALIIAIIVTGVALFIFHGIPYIESKIIQSTTPSKSPPITLSDKYYDFVSIRGVAIPPYFTKIIPYRNHSHRRIPTKKPDLSNLIQKRQPKIDPATAKEIAVAITKYSTKFNFPPELILCLIERESSFHKKAFSKPTSKSKNGCKGLMQINGKFHEEKLKKLGVKGEEIFDIDNNIHIGCMILREYYDKTGSISGALKKYLGGTNKGYMLDILTSFTDLMIEQK